MPAISPPAAIRMSSEYGRFHPANFEISVSRNGNPSPMMVDQIHEVDLSRMLLMTRLCISPTPNPIPTPTRNCAPPMPAASPTSASTIITGTPSNQPNQVVRSHKINNLCSIIRSSFSWESRFIILYVKMISQAGFTYGAHTVSGTANFRDASYDAMINISQGFSGRYRRKNCETFENGSNYLAI